MPVLHTARLALHPLSRALAWAVKEGTSGYACDPDFPRTDDLSLLDAVAASTDPVGHRYLLAAAQPDSTAPALIGTLGVAGACSPDGEQEIGYGLVPSARGRGLGTEAVTALCAVLEREPGLQRVTAQVESGNHRSLRLLTRLGFVEVDGGVDGHRKLARGRAGAPAVRPARISGRHVC